MGEKRRLNSTSEVNRQTHIWTNRLTESIGPEGRCFENWLRKGGHDIPLFIPRIPGEELVKRIRQKEAKNNQGQAFRFLVVGKGGVTLENTLRRSNPWAGDKC